MMLKMVDAAKTHIHTCTSIFETTKSARWARVRSLWAHNTSSTKRGIIIWSEDSSQTPVMVAQTTRTVTSSEYFHGLHTAMYWFTVNADSVSRYAVKNIQGIPRNTYGRPCKSRKSCCGWMRAKGPCGQFCVMRKVSDAMISAIAKFFIKRWYVVELLLRKTTASKKMMLSTIASTPRVFPVLVKMRLTSATPSLDPAE